MIAIAAFLLSGFLFWKNGGFGGGHGRYDLPVGVLAIPWMFIWPKWLWDQGDFYAFVLGPFLMNLAAIFVLRMAFSRKCKTNPANSD
jgi:hypothetical protein